LIKFDPARQSSGVCIEAPGSGGRFLEIAMEHFILKNGYIQRVGLTEWAQWVESGNGRVDQTYVGSIWISTMFLGVERGTLFETMILAPIYYAHNGLQLF
jgi:hypothetical protein